MARSLLEKHRKHLDENPKLPNLQLVPTPSQEKLTDEDWYHIHSFWRSSLFNRHYLRDDFQRARNKQLLEYEKDFQVFLNQFLNLCDSKRDEKFHTWNEDQTIRSWIMPVMELLGWWNMESDPVVPELTLTVQEGAKKKTLRPDCVFVPNRKLKGVIQEKSPDQRLDFARRYAIMILEAKYWDRIRKFDREEDEIGARVDAGKTRKGDSASSLSPGGQILTYLKHLRNDDPPRNHFGIVTDGKVWRLHHVERPESQFYEFDLGELFLEVTTGKTISDLKGKQYQHIEEAARYFYYIFSKKALFSDSGEPTLVDDLLSQRKKYVEAAETNLKDRFLTAMRHACNGFNRAFKEAGQSQDLAIIRDLAESYIFNILFLKSCEANGIIRYEANTDISITSIIERIAYFDPSDGIDEDSNEKLNLAPRFKEFTFTNDGNELHRKILNLTNFVETGGRLEDGSDFLGFKETLFSNEEKRLFSKFHLNNIETVRVLFELGFMEEDGKFKQIPYNIFTPEQLGSIYESFLEFTLSRAEEHLEYLNKQWKPLSKSTFDKLKRRERIKQPMAMKGELFFTPDNKERKASGSYYTPDHIVKFIVEETLLPLCKGKTATELLQLRICDPAMGSGHFLTGALRFLTQQYLEALQHEAASKYKSPIQAKREILDSCIFGVDKNPRAVRLGKMALWLETVHSGRKLERLTDQIKCTDSLIDEDLWKSEWSFKGFDAVIGNPPYLGEKGNKELFQQIVKGPLGKFYQGKIDLFYFFFHLGLDILKMNGRLGFITTNYFTTALGARNLRQDLYNRTSIELLMNLNELKVFSEASGQHNMITILKRTDASSSCRVISTTEKGKCTPETLDSILSGKNKNTYYSIVSKEDLYEGTQLYIRTNHPASSSGQDVFDSIFKKLQSKSKPLIALANVKTGLRTGLDRVTDKHLDEVPGLKKGNGIFVISNKERKENNLEASRFLKPLFKNSDVRRYGAIEKPSYYVFYIGKSDQISTNSIEANYLKQFKKLIEKIRWNEAIPWYSIVRPRKQTQFEGEKIICPQRSYLNIFGYSTQSWYASSDVYFITTKTKDITNKFLLGYLNSKINYLWLFIKGKRKGRALELYQKPLSEIQIPLLSEKARKSIEEIVVKIVKNSNVDLAEKIDAIIFDDLGLNSKEIAAINNFYASNAKSGPTDNAEFESDLDNEAEAA